jgi:co-chaperonin GroES (HSP10)
MTATRSTPTIPSIPISTNGQGPGPGRNVNVGRMALGVLLVLGLSAGFAFKYAQAGHRQSVLALAKDVPAGQALAAGDLKEVLVSADPALAPVPAAKQASVIGRSAGVALLKGTLLTDAQLATGPLVQAGRDVVGLSLKAGQVPLGVRVGDRVIVFRAATNPTGGSGTVTTDPGASAVSRNAQVLAIDAGSAANGGTTVIAVVVDASDAAAVAAAAAAGQASLVVEGGH